MKYLLTLIIGLMLLSTGVFAQVGFNINGSLCIGNELEFVGSTNLQDSLWIWDFGEGEIDTVGGIVKKTYESSGTYIVTLKVIGVDGNTYPTGEPYAESIDIHENPNCDFVVDSVYWSSFSRIFTDNSTSLNTIEEYIWDFGDNIADSVVLDTNIAEYKYSAEAVYNVRLQIIDEFGCSDSISQMVSVDDIYFVPNVFTPNGDNINDNFIAVVNGVDRFSIDIYSRWGNLIFSREGVNQIVWDGRLPDGSKVKPGTYFYKIEASDSQKNYTPKTGFIMVFYAKE